FDPRKLGSCEEWAEDEFFSKIVAQKDEILKANPWMSEDVAAAWARLAPNRKVFEGLIEKINPNKAWAVQGRGGVNLYMQPSPVDGDCVFWSVGTKRSDVVNLLKENLFGEGIPELQKRGYQQMLGEGIYR